MRTRLLSLVALAAVAVSTFAAPAAAGNPETRYVDDDGTAGAAGCGGALSVPSAIQSAVEAAASGDTILVCPGTYTEQLFIETPGLTIRSIQPWKARVRAPVDLAGSPAVLVQVVGNDTTLQWLRLDARAQAPCEPVQQAIAIYGGATGVVVRSLRIGVPAGDTLYGPCGYQEGIRVESGSEATIATTTITGFQGYGVYGNVGSDVTVQFSSLRFWHQDVCGRLACTAASPASFVNAGVLLFGEGLVRGNAITGKNPATSQVTRVGAGIILSGPGVARSNRIFETGTGIETNGAARVIGNTIEDSTAYGIQVLADDGVIRGNTVSRSGTTGIIAWSSASDNLFRNNTATASTVHDCADQSGNLVPAGVPGHPIDNTWVGNHGNTDSPNGICQPLP